MDDGERRGDFEDEDENENEDDAVGTCTPLLYIPELFTHFERLMRRLFLMASVSFAAASYSLAQTNGTSPSFQEVYDLVRQHDSGVSEAELNRAAVQGLISALGPRVSLVTNGVAGGGSAEVKPVSQAKFFEGDIAYFRISRVGPGLPKAVADAFRKLDATNEVSGVVLDLRYTDGSDYKSAAATADLFVSKGQPLLSWNGSALSSNQKTNAIAVPVAVLVNHETAGASEALAAILREANVALILGSRTAGAAMLTHDYPLKDDVSLRIASTPIELADGSRLSAEGIKPDIDVTLSEEQERRYYADEFLVVPQSNHLAGASTNEAGETNEAGAPVIFNEAELVREHKAGETPEDEQPAKRAPEPKAPVVSDPALARALDLLKGLAVVRQGRS